MEGELAGLFINGKQVGGLVNWSLDLNVATGTDGKAQTCKVASWKLKAGAYWLYKKPAGLITVRLFADEGQGYWEGKASLDSVTRSIYDTLIEEMVELTGTGVLTGGQLDSKQQGPGADIKKNQSDTR